MDDVTRALNGMADGDGSGPAELLAAIYDELHRMAAGKMAGERSGHTLQAAALVHEARLRLAGDGASWENRRHFFGAASADEKLLQVHEVLDELEAEDPLKAKIVKLRFFAGLRHDEIAALLELNEKTVRRHWELAKVRLYRAIRDGS